MIKLHDTTRRWVCRIAFLVLGVAPTCVIGVWCCRSFLPGYLASHAQKLSEQLRLPATLGGMQHLRPRVVLYEGLELSDPETREVIVRCRRLEVDRPVPRENRPPLLRIMASQLEVDAQSLDRLWQCLQSAMEGLGGPLQADVTLVASEVTLTAGHSQTLTDVCAGIEALAGGVHAQLEFRVPGVDSPDPVRIRIVRNREISPPASGFELYTGGGDLPCTLLALGSGHWKGLGSQSCFRGYIWANESPDGWQGEVTGQIGGLDLGGLVSEHFPYRLSGVGEATIQSARFRRGRLDDASITLEVGPGAMDPSLIDAAVERLGLIPRIDMTRPTNADSGASQCVPYDRLALSAVLDINGLRLVGRCDAEGALLCRGGDCLLRTPVGRPLPIASLVHTLAPQGTIYVPANRQAEWLLHHLPLPLGTSLPDADDAAPQARLRPQQPLRR